MSNWPHAPSRQVDLSGSYIVTAGTYHKELFFRGDEKLAFLQESLLTLAMEFGWQLEAWAIFPNHYHFVGRSPDSGSSLQSFTSKLHGTTARWLNKLEATAGRKVWYSYWQTRLTYERSYLARLNYVHQNAVRHGLVQDARLYPYCSADWLYCKADPAWYEVVSSFPIDQVNVLDDYDVK